LKYFAAFIVSFCFLQFAYPQDITLMTYNIRYDNPLDYGNAWLLRKGFVLDQIKRESPDILGIQEGLHSQVLFLDSALGSYRRVGVGRDDGSTLGEYCAIYYKEDRFIADSSGTFWLSPTPNRPGKGWDAALPRICTWLVLRDTLTQQSIAILNTHFDHIGSEARKESSRLLVEYSNRLIDNGLKVFLMGDFNCNSASAPAKIIRKRFKDSMEGKKAGDFSDQGTYNAFNTSKLATERIDFIFYRASGLKVRRAWMLIEMYEERYPSDHFPVLATFSFTAA
jgi:endonuclease/exonuclease/phosphatase family metal-dependent hydrolase